MTRWLHTLSLGLLEKNYYSVTNRERFGNFKIIITKMTENAKWGRYYKVRHEVTLKVHRVLQSVTIITKWHMTPLLPLGMNRKMFFVVISIFSIWFVQKTFCLFLIFKDFLPFKRYLKHLIAFSQVKYNLSFKRTTFARL